MGIKWGATFVNRTQWYHFSVFFSPSRLLFIFLLCFVFSFRIVCLSSILGPISIDITTEPMRNFSALERPSHAMSDVSPFNFISASAIFFYCILSDNKNRTVFYTLHLRLWYEKVTEMFSEDISSGFLCFT